MLPLDFLPTGCAGDREASSSPSSAPPAAAEAKNEFTKEKEVHKQMWRISRIPTLELLHVERSAAEPPCTAATGDDSDLDSGGGGTVFRRRGRHGGEERTVIMMMPAPLCTQ